MENSNQLTRQEIVKKFRKRSQAGEIWRRFKRNKSAVVGLLVIVLVFMMAIFADVIADYDEVVVQMNYEERMEGPSLRHIFGTDEFGRDIFARVAHGSRISLMVGFAASAISLGIGAVIGAIAGYYGGGVDNTLMRLMDILLAVPSTLLAIALVAAFGSSVPNLMLAIGLSTIPQYSRVVRASVLTVRDQEYVEASKAVGARDYNIILQDIIPNCVANIIVQVTLSVAVAILAIAGLSFVGLGVKPPTPEWGAMLSAGRNYLRDAWWMTVFPGLAIAFTILGLNLLGDGLRDALDPRLKQ